MDVAPRPGGVHRVSARGAAIVTLVAATAVLLISRRQDLPAVWSSLSAARPVWVAAAAVGVVLGLANLAALHAAAQRTAGLQSGVRDVGAPALAAQFLNLLVSSGGLAGLGAFRADGRRRGLVPGRVTAAYLLVAVAGQLAVVALLPFAFVILVGTGRLTAPVVAVSVVFLGYSSVLVLLVVQGMRNRAALRRAYALPRRLMAWTLRRPGRVIDHTRADELHDALNLLRRSGAGVRIGLHAVGVDVTGIILLWLVFHALRMPLGFPVAVVAYAVSLMFSIVGILPAGLGFVEVSLAGVLVAYGASGATAAAAVGLFRLFELWVPFTAGAVAARFVLRTES